VILVRISGIARLPHLRVKAAKGCNKYQ